MKLVMSRICSSMLGVPHRTIRRSTSRAGRQPPPAATRLPGPRTTAQTTHTPPTSPTTTSRPVASSDRAGDQHDRAGAQAEQDREEEEDPLHASADAGDRLDAEPGDQDRVDDPEQRVQRVLDDRRPGDPQDHAPDLALVAQV